MDQMTTQTPESVAGSTNTPAAQDQAVDPNHNDDAANADMQTATADAGADAETQDEAKMEEDEGAQAPDDAAGHANDVDGLNNAQHATNLEQPTTEAQRTDGVVDANNRAPMQESLDKHSHGDGMSVVTHDLNETKRREGRPSMIHDLRRHRSRSTSALTKDLRINLDADDTPKASSNITSNISSNISSHIMAGTSTKQPTRKSAKQMGLRHSAASNLSLSRHSSKNAAPAAPRSSTLAQHEGSRQSSNLSQSVAAASAASSTTGVGNTSLGRQRVYRTVHVLKSKTKKSATAQGRSGHQPTVKWVTREIAALDFLLNIPMQAEQRIVSSGWLREQGYDPADYDDQPQPDNNKASIHAVNTEPHHAGDLATNYAFRKSTSDADNSIDASSHGVPGQPPRDAGDVDHDGMPKLQNDPRPAPVFHPTGRWWDKWIPYVASHTAGVLTSNADPTGRLLNQKDIEAGEAAELEQPDDKLDSTTPKSQLNPYTAAPNAPMSFAAAPMSQVPGRRLEGDIAVAVQIPLTVDTTVTRQRSVARQAAVRQWELRLAHGLQHQAPSPMNRGLVVLQNKQPQDNRGSMLDGRMFFAAAGGYPMGVYSILKYEPRKEEAILRRRKLEALGGGGTQFFAMPARDWRGISYRQLLVVVERRREDFAKQVGLAAGVDSGDSMADTTKRGPTPSLFNRFTRSNERGGTFASLSDSNKAADSDKDGIDDGEAHGSGKNKDPENNNNNNTNDDDGNDDGDDDDVSSLSSFDSQYDDDDYVPGLLDDPEMVQGRHRNVMIGDRDTGCIVSSTIQFVKPSLLKADLNQQFRDRFDGWEPPKSQRKYIGARVVDGVYTLMEPGEGENNNDDASTIITTNTETLDPTNVTATPSRRRKGSVGSVSSVNNPHGGGGGSIGNTGQGSESISKSGHKKKSSGRNAATNNNNSAGSVNNNSASNNNNANNDTNTKNKKDTKTIRIPPSLTLSKIRSIKMQALRCAMKAKLELGTLALTFVYFERLCLDCRVDKTNRRLSFAACLLLAIKSNESHVALMTHRQNEAKPTTSHKKASRRIQSLIRPTKKSSSMFACVLEFFTQDWSLSLQHVFAAEWGVFAALQFRLHATPSQVAFHFKRLLKIMSWDGRKYLGAEMYGYWQDALLVEEYHKAQRAVREERREKRRKNHRLLQIQRELDDATTRHDDGIPASIERVTDDAAATAEIGNASGSDIETGAGSRRRGKNSANSLGKLHIQQHLKLYSGKAEAIPEKKPSSSTGGAAPDLEAMTDYQYVTPTKSGESQQQGHSGTTAIGAAAAAAASSLSLTFGSKIQRRFSSSGNLTASPHRSTKPATRLPAFNKLFFGKRNASSDRLNITVGGTAGTPPATSLVPSPSSPALLMIGRRKQSKTDGAAAEDGDDARSQDLEQGVDLEAATSNPTVMLGPDEGELELVIGANTAFASSAASCASSGVSSGKGGIII